MPPIRTQSSSSPPPPSIVSGDFKASRDDDRQIPRRPPGRRPGGIPIEGGDGNRPGASSRSSLTSIFKQRPDSSSAITEGARARVKRGSIASDLWASAVTWTSRTPMEAHRPRRLRGRIASRVGRGGRDRFSGGSMRPDRPHQRRFETPVGKVHLGVVHLFMSWNRAERLTEGGRPGRCWVPSRSVTFRALLRGEFETWSQFCIDALLSLKSPVPAGRAMPRWRRAGGGRASRSRGGKSSTGAYRLQTRSQWP